LKLECDELLSSFAFNFNLRRYNVVRPAEHPAEAGREAVRGVREAIGGG
jgi:hypothetical protein